MLAAATAALDLQRTRQARPTSRAALRSQRRLDRHHRSLLRHVPATDPRLSGQLTLWLTAVGRVHHLDAQLTSESIPLRGIPWDTPGDSELDTADTAPSADGPSARLAVAVALVRRDDTVSGQDVADAFTHRGWSATPRTGQRWLAKARASPGRYCYVVARLELPQRAKGRRRGCRAVLCLALADTSTSADVRTAVFTSERG